MNAGGTSERVYDALKRRILEREFRPGARLDPAALSETLNSSVTPVRDCLNTLRGERLVETRASEGFHLPHVDTPGLRDLYDWNAAIIGLAIRAWRAPAASPDPILPISAEPLALAQASAVTFAQIGNRSTNLEHRHAITSANDRLHAVRLAETKILDGIPEELTGIQRSLAQGNIADLKTSLALYHRRRHRAADEIIRTLYRNGGPR